MVSRRVVQAGSALVAAIAVAAAVMRAVRGEAAAAVSTIGAVVFALVAVAVAFWMTRRLQPGEPLQVQVGAIGVGMAALVAGDVLYWLYESVLKVEPYPSFADAFYVASFPLIGGGLLLALRAFSRGQRPTAPIVASAAASVLATILVWSTVLAQLFADREVPVLEKVLGAVYPLGDVWLLLFPALALALALGRFAGGRLATPWFIVAGGALAMAVTDAAFTWMDYAGTYESGGMLDVGWWAAYAAIALGLIALAEAQGIGGGARR